MAPAFLALHNRMLKAKVAFEGRVDLSGERWGVLQEQQSQAFMLLVTESLALDIVGPGASWGCALHDVDTVPGPE